MTFNLTNSAVWRQRRPVEWDAAAHLHLQNYPAKQKSWIEHLQIANTALHREPRAREGGKENSTLSLRGMYHKMTKLRIKMFTVGQLILWVVIFHDQIAIATSKPSEKKKKKDLAAQMSCNSKKNKKNNLATILQPY